MADPFTVHFRYAKLSDFPKDGNIAMLKGHWFDASRRVGDIVSTFEVSRRSTANGHVARAGAGKCCRVVQQASYVGTHDTRSGDGAEAA